MHRIRSGENQWVWITLMTNGQKKHNSAFFLLCEILRQHKAVWVWDERTGRELLRLPVAQRVWLGSQAHWTQAATVTIATNTRENNRTRPAAAGGEQEREDVSRRDLCFLSSYITIPIHALWSACQGRPAGLILPSAVLVVAWPHQRCPGGAAWRVRFILRGRQRTRGPTSTWSHTTLNIPVVEDTAAAAEARV